MKKAHGTALLPFSTGGPGRWRTSAWDAGGRGPGPRGNRGSPSSSPVKKTCVRSKFIPEIARLSTAYVEFTSASAEIRMGV